MLQMLMSIDIGSQRPWALLSSNALSSLAGFGIHQVESALVIPTSTESVLVISTEYSRIILDANSCLDIHLVELNFDRLQGKRTESRSIDIHLLVLYFLKELL